MLRALLPALALTLCLCLPSGKAAAQDQQDLQSILQTEAEEVASPGRRSVGSVIDALVASELPQAPEFLQRWSEREVLQRTTDGLFFYGTRDGDSYALTDLSTGEPAGSAPASDIEEIRPNGGVRRVIASALVQFQLSDPIEARRIEALDSIARNPSADQLDPLLASIEGEPSPRIRARKEELAGMLAATFGDTPEERIAAISALSDGVSVQIRAVLNQILSTRSEVGTEIPEGANIARELTPGDDLTREEAYARLNSGKFASA